MDADCPVLHIEVYPGLLHCQTWISWWHNALTRKGRVSRHLCAVHMCYVAWLGESLKVLTQAGAILSALSHKHTNICEGWSGCLLCRTVTQVKGAQVFLLLHCAAYSGSTSFPLFGGRTTCEDCVRLCSLFCLGWKSSRMRLIRICCGSWKWLLGGKKSWEGGDLFGGYLPANWTSTLWSELWSLLLARLACSLRTYFPFHLLTVTLMDTGWDTKWGVSAVRVQRRAEQLALRVENSAD